MTGVIKVWLQAIGSLELVQLTSVWRVTNGKNGLEPAGAAGDGAMMHPDIEGGATAIGAVAALPYATDGQGGNMQSGIIARNTSGASRRED
jgi:hypothetical protein